MKILRWSSLDSTNNQAKRLLQDGLREAVVLVAENQTAGRGQQDRVFQSPAGGLYFTLLDSPAIDQAFFSRITLAVGVACAEILEELTGLSVALKWPNDLYTAQKKVGGILCESVVHSDHPTWVIIGVGINVNTTVIDFPDHLKHLMTSLKEQTGSSFDLEQLLSTLLVRIEEKISLLSTKQELLLDQWQQRDYLKNKSLQYDDGQTVRLAKGVGITQQGTYRVELSSGEQVKVLFGRIQPAG